MSLRDDINIDLYAHGYSRSGYLTMIKAWMTHPSLRLLINYRLAQKITNQQIKRLLWWNITSKTGCHISLNTIIEPGVIFPHATSIVVGNGAHISSGVKIFQNVTIAIANDEQNKAATIKKGAQIYVGAVLIGDITIGENAVIAANSVVKINVPDCALAAGAPAKIKNANNK